VRQSSRKKQKRQNVFNVVKPSGNFLELSARRTSLFPRNAFAIQPLSSFCKLSGAEIRVGKSFTANVVNLCNHLSSQLQISGYCARL